MILHTLPVMDHEGAGPSYSVPRLCEALNTAGIPTKLAVLDWIPEVVAPPYVKRFQLGIGPRRLGRSPSMESWLIQQAKCGNADVIHSHGLWMMPNVYAGRARLAGAARLVISPRGTVSEWAWRHHRGRKLAMWHLLGQRHAMHASDAFHATSEQEFEQLRRLGFRQPVCVLPNGIDVPTLETKSQPVASRTLLYLGRIHKIKGIDLLLKAWAKVEARFPHWNLVIAGPDDGGYLEQYKKLSAELKLIRVSFPGPIYGKAKLALYRAAHLYVLPTHSENFGLTVAESLAAGTPAIVTRGAPWAGLIDHKAGWWIEIGVEPLVSVLEEALSLPDSVLFAMGSRGREWMLSEYSWDTICRRMVEFYAWLRTDGFPPAFVRVG